jgi:hypothetical protein
MPIGVEIPAGTCACAKPTHENKSQRAKSARFMHKVLFHRYLASFGVLANGAGLGRAEKHCDDGN